MIKRHALILIEDDVYADLHNGNGTRLAALDQRVIYVGSFSKTLSPVLRVGSTPRHGMPRAATYCSR